jgi:hypothetical protein
LPACQITKESMTDARRGSRLQHCVHFAFEHSKTLISTFDESIDLDPDMAIPILARQPFCHMAIPPLWFNNDLLDNHRTQMLGPTGALPRISGSPDLARRANHKPDMVSGTEASRSGPLHRNAKHCASSHSTTSLLPREMPPIKTTT